MSSLFGIDNNTTTNQILNAIKNDYGAFKKALNGNIRVQLLSRSGMNQKISEYKLPSDTAICLIHGQVMLVNNEIPPYVRSIVEFSTPASSQSPTMAYRQSISTPSTAKQSTPSGENKTLIANHHVDAPSLNLEDDYAASMMDNNVSDDSSSVVERMRSRK